MDEWDYIPSGNSTQLLKMAIHSGFSHSKGDLNHSYVTSYQRVLLLLSWDFLGDFMLTSSSQKSAKRQAAAVRPSVLLAMRLPLVASVAPEAEPKKTCFLWGKTGDSTWFTLRYSNVAMENESFIGDFPR